MGHDQLFKTLLEGHLPAFLELFFPKVAKRLDFATLRFLDKELFTDFPEGSLREADVVAELETHQGEPELVLIHIEVQARPEKDFGKRMYEYYALLQLRYRVPVFPIVMYLRGGEGLIGEEYRVVLFGHEQLRFRYMSVGLARLEPREYVEKSPMGAALAALMNRAREADPFELRVAILRKIGRSALDDALKFLLVNVVETYFPLSGEEEQRFRQLLSKKGYREVEEMEVTWADKMMARGLIQGKRETLLRQLTAKFGAPSEETRSRIQALESAEELDTYLDRILTARSIEDMGLES